jgi:NAD(P)-dependent dehydrogenase (short-subunit alcohol dehydrogenase family)
MDNAQRRTIVITGSTRGIGLGLARVFVESGQRVVISGRTQQSVDSVVERFEELRPGCAAGTACNVRKREDVEQLWSFAVKRFGQVDIWINNAGISHEQSTVYALSPEKIQAVIETNITGALYGVHTAVNGMMKQGGGIVYLLEGLGSDGRRVKGLGLYGSTKHCLHYLMDRLTEELKDSPVRMGSIQPGMVLTDMLIGDDLQKRPDWETNKKVFNILADRVDVVAPWIAREVLKNQEHGRRISRMSTLKAAWRFLSYPFTKRDVISDLLDSNTDL